MVEQDVVYVTEEGLQKIKEELAYLKGEKKHEMAIKLEAAIAQGDLKENADYHAAKEEQAFVEARIKDLEDTLRRAKIIADTGPSDVVRVGSVVTVVEDGYDDEETYYIVGAHEADPSNGRISNESPIGQALLGAKKGHIVSASTPSGVLRLQIKAIS
ncbi:MAG: transcription elongation factor GreA [Anaerolineae bacterium]|nr:transcription elongation factor GreA [Anaerolineae bacterium]